MLDLCLACMELQHEPNPSQHPHRCDGNIIIRLPASVVESTHEALAVSVCCGSGHVGPSVTNVLCYLLWEDQEGAAGTDRVEY